MGSANPPLDYLISSSQSSLESYELSRLNVVANLRKELRQIVDEWVEAEIEARMARWILDRRRLESWDAQAPLPALSHPAPSSAPVVPALPSLGNDCEPQSRDSAIVVVNHLSRSIPAGQSRRKVSQRAPLSRNRELPFDAQAGPDPAAFDSTYPTGGHGHESAPNLSAAAYALEGLERVVHTGANVLYREQGAPEKLHTVEAGTATVQLPSSGLRTAQGKPLASDPPPAGKIFQLAKKWESSRLLSALAVLAQGRDLPDGGDERHVPPSKSSPVQKPHPPCRPISIYRHRVAAAS